MVIIRFKLRRALWGASAVAAVFALTVLGVHLAREATKEVVVEESYVVPVVLIDAGHGGEDGGAVGVDGLVEKDLNLGVALQLDWFLRALGYETVMTRCEDCDLHSEEAGNLRERKRSDIQARFAMMEALSEDDLFVSIHMNKFGQASARGTQVFYSTNLPQSAVLAESIQCSVVRLLQPNNSRQVKPSGDEIYLLYRAQRVAVLVECGFISNAAEAVLLQDEAYQRQMAFAIAVGVLDYHE